VFVTSARLLRDIMFVFGGKLYTVISTSRTIGYCTHLELLFAEYVLGQRVILNYIISK
jgi:hypothetical protein